MNGRDNLNSGISRTSFEMGEVAVEIAGIMGRGVRGNQS